MPVPSRTFTISTLTTVHSLDVHLQFLRLTELSATKVAERPRTLGVGGTAVGAMHIQVVETEEELQRHTSTDYSPRTTVRAKRASLCGSPVWCRPPPLRLMPRATLWYLHNPILPSPHMYLLL